MLEPRELRATVERELPKIVKEINAALSGQKVARLEPVLARIGRGGTVPH